MLSPVSAPERTLRRLDWTIVRRLDGLLQGDYRTLFRGQGLDLADIREYVAGDDVRNIDWNVTARLDAPHVREYLEDREITAHFLLDLSPSVDFGTASAHKRDLLVDFVGLVARLLTRHGNRVGAILYGKQVEKVVPARGGRMQVLRLIDEMQRRPRWEKPLGLLARRHETLAIRLTDPRERELPDIGFVIMTDSETGEALHIDTHDARFRKRFAEVVDRRERALGAAFRRAGVDTLELSTEEDLVRAVVRFAATRKLRRARHRAMGHAS